MKVIEHRVAREGKKDKRWMEVQFNREEWTIILIIAVAVSFGIFASNGVSTQYKGNLMGAVAGAYLMLAIFVYVVWFFMTVWAVYYARKNGIIATEVS